MISWIIVAVLAVALAITIYYITHQKAVHAAQLAAERNIRAGVEEGRSFWIKAHGTVSRAYSETMQELKALKLKIEADAKALAAEPGKIVAAVEGKITGKKKK